MNLNAIAEGIVGAVNPRVFCTVLVSAGYVLGSDGVTQVPQYTTYQNVPVQLQPLSGKDIYRMGGVNLQQTQRSAYLDGNYEGIDRNAIKGGDIVQVPPMPGFPTATNWLVTGVIEHFADWTKIAITLQVGATDINGIASVPPPSPLVIPPLGGPNVL